MGTLRGYAVKKDASASMAQTAMSIIDSIRNSAWVTQLTAVSDQASSCGGGKAAQARRDQGVSAWRFVFLGEWENQAIYPGMGAYHSMDCPIVFGTVELKREVKPNTPQQEQFIKNVMTAWASFAKDPDSGLTKLGWPVYDASSKFFGIFS
jgi:carboxylesterase type B